MSEMIAFFPTYDTTPVPTQQIVVDQAPTVTQTVVVQQVASRTDLLAEESEWGWAELRDYVVAQIQQRFGAFPRDAKKEYGIFSRYINTHGARGVLAAKIAFEVHDGWWNNAPISINRFTKGSDPFFVEPILARHDDTAA